MTSNSKEAQMRELTANEIVAVGGGDPNKPRTDENPDGYLPEIVVTPATGDDGGFFGGGTVALGPALGFTSRSGHNNLRLGAGIGYQFDGGYAANDQTLDEQVEQDGLVVFFGICTSISGDFSGDDAFIRGKFGVGIFYTENLQ